MFRILTEISGGVTGCRSSYVKADGEVLEFHTEIQANTYVDTLRSARSPYTTFEQRWIVEPVPETCSGHGSDLIDGVCPDCTIEIAEFDDADNEAAPRQCYYIPAGQRDEHGFIPSLVTEHKAGHAPLIGRGEGASPWYWGDTIEEAEDVCERMNAEHFGIDAETAWAIVESSMFPNKARG